MTVRAVIISFFIIAISFGMTVVNYINVTWAAEHGGVPFIGGSIFPFVNETKLNIPTTESGYNSTTRQLMTFNKPSDAVSNYDIFQSLTYGTFLIDLLFNSVFGFPTYLVNAFGMPEILAIPLISFVFLNHILAIIYIVTGRTFIY
jgi:hypothetical protein